MLRRRLDRLLHILRERPAALLALVGQVVALIGLPLPAVSAKDTSSPFPCQHRRCGCMCAADCWNHCCCFSAQERVSWAREHQAEVPDSLVQQARQPQGPDSGVCCDPQKSKSRKPSTPAGNVLGFMARQCHGQPTLWGDGEPAPLPGPAATWAFEAQPAGWCVSSIRHLPSVSWIPLVPPPRG
jgi:hypothetical protein